MPTAIATRTLESYSVDELWARVGDFANPDWLRGVTRLRIEGQGPGAVRVLGVPGGVELRETLVSEGERSLTWSMDDGSPLPVRDYEATIAVDDDGGRARITWTSRFESAGPPDEILERMLTDMQTDMLRGL